MHDGTCFGLPAISLPFPNVRLTGTGYTFSAPKGLNLPHGPLCAPSTSFLTCIELGGCDLRQSLHSLAALLARYVQRQGISQGLMWTRLHVPRWKRVSLFAGHGGVLPCYHRSCQNSGDAHSFVRDVADCGARKTCGGGNRTLQTYEGTNAKTNSACHGTFSFPIVYERNSQRKPAPHLFLHR